MTYTTKHPTIKEISIGDKFILNDGETIVTVVKFSPTGSAFLVKCMEGIIHYNGNSSKFGWWYLTRELKFLRRSRKIPYKHLDIQCKIPSLKDKIYLL